MLVIGRDFPSSQGTMHPVAQFNITYAYSIVSRRRRRNRKGLCTPARFARDAQEGQKLVLHSNFLSDSCESCLASNQVSTKSRCLTITPRFTVICRDTDFRPNLRHLCLTRNGDRVGGHTLPPSCNGIAQVYSNRA